MATEYARPTPPGFWSYPVDRDQYKADRELYDTQEKLRMARESGPMAGATLGQVSNLSNYNASDIASPDQITSRPASVDTGVPDWRSMQPLSNEPQVRPPMMGAGQGSNMSLDYTHREPNLEAPANRMQQALGESALHRERTWPRSIGGAGAGTLQAKIQALTQSGLSEDEARQYAVLGGTAADKAANLQQRTATGVAREQNLNAGTEIIPRRQDEIERANHVREAGLAESRRFNREHQQAMVRARDTGDKLAAQRLDFAFEKHHDILDRWDAMNKAGTLTPEIQDAMARGLHMTDEFIKRDATPEEETYIEQLGSAIGLKPSPRLERKPSAVPTQRGVPPSQRGTPAKGGPTQIKSDADYDKLPSGTTFLDPQGKQRVKP